MNITYIYFIFPKIRSSNVVILDQNNKTKYSKYTLVEHGSDHAPTPNTLLWKI